ncbi:pseudouridine synthase [Veronia nyctiphanis]|uniref:Pseudouridine synthase n=1 Tax=Veronia nyctiphanis TaxID=1278244 RepID=A0A4Q0YX60_9GAMM|nr:pitrilysin family protein [Veronia nyctiphanis]RXJ73651.1 pseudouridine synthase [Veronia nyctiphanis]
MKMQLRTKLSAVALSLAASFSSFSALADYKKITEVEGITEYRYDNGLQVLLFPDPSKETVTVNVTYRVGSKHESYGETGMAHLLEHLVFKGTPKHKNIPAELSAHGARPNGTTFFDRTNYFETFASTEENIDWALSMESDRMVNSFIAQKDLDSEMTVVRNEFEMGENSPFSIMFKRIMATAYDWHNYGKTTIGARSDIENVSIERLKAFYKKYYQPDNATLVVAGKFKPDELLEKIDDTFGNIPKPERILERTYTSEPAKDGEREFTVRRVGDVQIVGGLYHIPPGGHKDYPAIEVLSQILTATPNGRLHKELVENKLATSAFGLTLPLEDPGVTLFGAQIAKDANLDATEQAFLKTVENIQENKITQEELETAKQALLKNFKLALNSSEYISVELSEFIGMGDWRLMFLNRDRLEQVTVEDVQRVAQQYLVRNNRTLGRFIPAAEPERVEIAKVTDLSKALEGYKGREQVAQGEAFEPSFDNIERRTENLRLASGAKVALIQKKTRGESVVIQISGQMGDLESLKGKSAIGSAAGALLLKGTTTRSREEIKTALDQLETAYYVGGGNGSFFGDIETTKTNLTPAMQVITDVLRNPSFPKKEFDLYKEEQRVAIEQMMQDPEALASMALRRLHSPYEKGHPRYTPTFEEQLEELAAVKYEDVAAYYKRFYGADQMQISVIGDFDKDAVIKALNTLTADWASSEKYSRIVTPYFKLPTESVEFNTPDKENAMFFASMTLPVGETHADAPALTLGNYILGGGFMNSRLASRLRQQDGVSYGAGSWLNMNSQDQKAALGAYAICAPQNLPKVEKGFKEELARLLKDGFTNEELEMAKSGLLQGRKVSRSQDNELASDLTWNLYLDRDMSFDKEFEQAMSKLTVEDLNKAFRKYVSVDDFALIKAGDMSKTN